jgi:RNA polymerase sigma factor (sigma-70 family)
MKNVINYNKLIEKLHKDYSAVMLAVAYNYLKDRAKAQDVHQDIWKKICDNASKKSEEEFVAYYSKATLCTMIRNECHNKYHNKHNSKTNYLSNQDKNDAGFEKNQKYNAIEKNDLRNSIEHSNLLDTIKDNLNEKDKQFFEWRREGFDFKEIAEIVNENVGALKMRWSRILKKIRQEFSEDYL